MDEKTKTILSWLECLTSDNWREFNSDTEVIEIAKCAIELIKEQDKKVRALKLLIEWAEECGLGFDCFPEEYKQYKDIIENISHVNGSCADGKGKIESVRSKRSKLAGEVCDKGILWTNTETKEQTLETYD